MMDLKVLRLPDDNGVIKEYRYKERVITMLGTPEMVTENKWYGDGDLEFAILDNLAKNGLSAKCKKIVSVSPIIMNHIEDQPRQEIVYGGYFCL